MNDAMEKAIEALLAKVCLTPYGVTYHVHIDDFHHTVAKLTRAMARLTEQRDGWRDKCGGYAMHWRLDVCDQQDAEIIEILTGDAE